LVGYTETSAGNRASVLRYNPDGSLDASFGSDGVVFFDGAAAAVTIDGSGRILVAGSTPPPSSSYDTDLAATALNAAGSLDQSFGRNGQAAIRFGYFSGGFAAASGVAVDSAGRIVVAGTTYGSPSTGPDFAVARLNADGSLDNTFDSDGKTTLS